MAVLRVAVTVGRPDGHARPRGRGGTASHSVLSVLGVGGVRIEDTFHLKDGQARSLVDCDAELRAA